MHVILKQVVLIGLLRMAATTSCKDATLCPCGRTGKSVRVCNPDIEDPCSRWAACERCVDGLDGCAECSQGIKGVSCTKDRHNIEVRRKRQLMFPASMNSYHQSYWQNNFQNYRQSQPTLRTSFCPELKSPKLGSIRCSTSNRQSTCIANCLPGHTFQNMGSTDEVQLSCERGVWTPYTEFPPCISGGHCDLNVKNAGSFNCTIRMTGTDCDVICFNRYAGRFHCFPGRGWDPPLPGCVEPKVVEETGCICENGGRCDSSGRCICPVGRTGIYCEIIVPERPTACDDPGFISNGVRRKTDGTESKVQRTFLEGESLVYSCQSRNFLLQGSGFLTCQDGTWSEPLPRCVRQREAPQVVTCPDPGHVSNADRLNSDGTPSPTVQRYGVGQSVVYTCHEGFALQGKSLIICSAQGSWSHDRPRCSRIPSRTTPPATEAPRVTCPDPGQVPDADRLNAEGIPLPAVQRYRVGQSVVYTCHEGFALQGNSIIICSAQGSWSRERPRCARIPSTTVTPAGGTSFCRDPGNILNGNRSPASAPLRRGFPEGSRLAYTCSPRYELSGNANLVCLSGGRWSSAPPKCEPQSRVPLSPGNDPEYCINPGSLSNGQIRVTPDLDERKRPSEELDDSDYPEGTVLQYSCNQGYVLEGPGKLTCEETGLWSDDPPSCTLASPRRQIRYCPNPGPLSNGLVQYTPRGETESNSTLESIRYRQGTRLQYSCNQGYTLEGANILTCESSGEWSDRIPTCLGVTSRDIMYCDNPGPIANGRVRHYPPLASRRSGSRPLADDDIEFPQGTRLEYTCEDGYMLQGSFMLTCESTGFWSTDPPTCTGECGRSFAQTTRRIIHGTKTLAGEWPWVVAISTQENGIARLICGGAVLNSRTVVTAAHCLTVAPNVTLQFGKINRRNKDDDAEVMVRHSTRFTLHPSFNSTTYDSDIGLVTFNPRIRFTDRVQPICLPTPETTAKNLMTGKKGYVTGWGLTEKSLQADELLLANLPVLSNDACMDSYRRQQLNMSVNQNMFCAGFEDGQQSTCRGDSGSPLVFYDRQTNKHTLEGLVSFGVRGQCGLPGRYTVFTKVFRFVPWVLREIS